MRVWEKNKIMILTSVCSLLNLFRSFNKELLSLLFAFVPTILLKIKLFTREYSLRNYFLQKKSWRVNSKILRKINEFSVWQQIANLFKILWSISFGRKECRDRKKLYRNLSIQFHLPLCGCTAHYLLFFVKSHGHHFMK